MADRWHLLKNLREALKLSVANRLLVWEEDRRLEAVRQVLGSEAARARICAGGGR